MNYFYKIIVFFLLCATAVFAQKKDWFEKDYRESNWPKTEYFKKYSVFSLEDLGDKNSSYQQKENFATELIKEELSKEIIITVNVTDLSVEQTIDGDFSNIFQKISKSETNITFPGLKIKKQKKGKSLHVFIYTKKNNLKDFAKNRFEIWVERLSSELVACKKLSNSWAKKEALERAKQIESDKKIVDNMSALLESLKVDVNRKNYNKLTQDLSYEIGILEDSVSKEEQYHQQKKEAENLIGNNLTDLQNKEILLKKCIEIAPDLAKEDGLNQILVLTQSNLFDLYCIEAEMQTKLKNWNKAINFYELAIQIDATKKINKSNQTPFEKLINCKRQQSEDLESLALQELKIKNFIKAKQYFEEAKDIIITLENNKKQLEKVNKNIRFCDKKINTSSNRKSNTKEINSSEKIPAKILIRVSGGLNSYMQNWESFKFNEISFHPKALNISGFLGYRFNLRDEVRISNRGKYDRSKGNALGLFVTSGNDYFSALNDSYRSFTEIEAGILWKEIFRLSLGAGWIGKDINNITLEDIPYYVATASLSINFGQAFISPSLSYLSKQQATITGDDKIRSNLSIGFRIMLF